MSDNTQLNPGSLGDVIRDIDRGTGVKTQVNQIDIGGPSNNPESLLTGGQHPNATSVPVVLSSEQDLGTRLDLIYAELKLITRFLQIGLNIEDEPHDFRNDPSYLS